MIFIIVGNTEYNLKLSIEKYMIKDKYKKLIQEYMDKLNISYTSAIQ